MKGVIVGCVGLGVMGRPAALNLARAGFRLHVWARRREALEPALAAGATAESDLPALAAAADFVVVNVSDTADVEEVVLGDGGLRDGLSAGKTVIDMSTIAPAAAGRIAAALAEDGAAFLDAPVSGGEKGAIEGTLTFMVGGDKAAFERAMPLFLAMGKTITRIGAAGAGQTAKACNQIIIGAALSAVADSFALARACGVDLATLRRALLGGFAASKVLETHAQRAIDGDYAPGFRARLHDKDIGIALAEAARVGVSLPVAEDFRRRLRRLIEEGGGDLDSAAVARPPED